MAQVGEPLRDENPRDEAQEKVRNKMTCATKVTARCPDVFGLHAFAVHDMRGLLTIGASSACVSTVAAQGSLRKLHTTSDALNAVPMRSSPRSSIIRERQKNMSRFHAPVFVGIITTVWMLFVAAVYLPDIGRGFVKDDFGWVEQGRAALAHPTDPLLSPPPGFYRPLVTFTFAADYALHGGHPRPYGFTNLLLYFGCVASLWLLLQSLSLPPVAATVGTLVWAVNPHGINMALVWISGRTSLCLTLSAVLSAIAVVRRRYAWVAIFVGCALVSKEEAVALPAILLGLHATLVRNDDSGRFPPPLVLGLGVPTALYLAFRLHTSAFTPFSAPHFYRFSFALPLVFRNIGEYADRAGTAAVVTMAIAAVTCWQRPRLRPDRRRLVVAGMLWIVGGFVLTVFLPVRSSLYAVFPSVGAAVICAVVLEGMLDADKEQKATVRLAVVLAASLLALVPAYRARNGRYVEPARFSERALRIISADAAVARTDGTILLHDIDDPTASFVSAFGTFATDAVRLRTGRNVTIWIDPPPGDWDIAGLRQPDPGAVVAEYAVANGRVFQVHNKAAARWSSPGNAEEASTDKLRRCRRRGAPAIEVGFAQVAF